MACVLVGLIALAMVVAIFDKQFLTRVREWVGSEESLPENNLTSSQERPTGGQTLLVSILTRTLRRGSTMDQYAEHAVARIGEDSVYSFLLGSSWCGWAIALATIATQLWLLFTFVKASEITDWAKDRYDVVYSYKCSWDDDECSDKSDLDWEGVLAFGIITGAHVSKDIINGIRMVVLSTQSTKINTYNQSEVGARLRFFAGGWLLVTVTSFTVYASAGKCHFIYALLFVYSLLCVFMCTKTTRLIICGLEFRKVYNVATATSKSHQSSFYNSTSLDATNLTLSLALMSVPRFHFDRQHRDHCELCCDHFYACEYLHILSSLHLCISVLSSTTMTLISSFIPMTTGYNVGY